MLLHFGPATGGLFAGVRLLGVVPHRAVDVGAISGAETEDPPFLLEGVPTSFCLNWIIDEQFRFMSGVHSNENC